MKFVNQKDYPEIPYITRQLCDKEEDREKGKTTTISSSGCGLCSAVMVADRLIPNCEFGVQDAVDLSYECKANIKIGTAYTRFAPAFAEKLGLDYEMSNDPERLRYCLRTGGAAVLHIKGANRGDYVGVFSSGGHYVAAVSEERDGRIALVRVSRAGEASYYDLHGGAIDPGETEIEALIQKRQEARKARDFATADAIRDELKARNIILEDTAQGVKWHYAQ